MFHQTDMTQAADYRTRVTQMEQLQSNINGIRLEIDRLEKDERKKNEKATFAAKVGSNMEWKRNYGESKRVSNSDEKFLSYVRLMVSHFGFKVA